MLHTDDEYLMALITQWLLAREHSPVTHEIIVCFPQRDHADAVMHTLAQRLDLKHVRKDEWSGYGTKIRSMTERIASQAARGKMVDKVFIHEDVSNPTALASLKPCERPDNS